MMKTGSFIGGLLAVLMVLAVSHVHAQVKFTNPEAKIAIVDVQVIMREALSAKSAREQMDAIAQKERAALAEEEKSLRARDQALQQERALLTAELFAQRQRELQADVANLQRKSRTLRLTLDQGFQRTMDQIQLVLFDELRKLSGELDLTLILSRSQIVIAVDDFDITKPALERLNKRLPSIELTLEKDETAKEAQ
jgi:Skp family chaperone for outer membrane proteins